MDEELLAQLQALMVQPDAAAPPAPGAQPGLGLGTFIKEGLIPFGQRVSQGIRDIPFQARRAGRAFQRSTDAGREQQAKDSRRAARARADLREKRAAQRRRRVEARGLFAQSDATANPPNSSEEREGSTLGRIQSGLVGMFGPFEPPEVNPTPTRLRPAARGRFLAEEKRRQAEENGRPRLRRR
jgi:hypothetical protein